MPLSRFQPEHYTELLAQKTASLQALMQPFSTLEPQVFASPLQGFRMRAEFRFWHTENDGYYAMFPKGQPDQPIRIDQFPIAHPNINRLMQQLRDAVVQSELLKNRLFQVEFLTTLSGDSLVTLIYHKMLDEQWQAEARTLEQQLGTAIIGRSRKQKLVLSRDYVDECLQVHGRAFHYRQMEGGFTQPNAIINQYMLGWAQQQLQDIGGDFLELYCGNGNFTVALAQQFRQVLATEISKTSVKAAQHNFACNGINNVKVCRLSSEDMTAALNQERAFRRLAEQQVELADYHFSTVLVDPPRAGLDAATLGLVQQFNHILYISCNPQTLKSNLQQLQQTHHIKSLALFDQFPYTDHIETGVFLQKHSS